MNSHTDIRVADPADIIHTEIISQWYHLSSLERGTGIAQRKPEYLNQKILNGNAIIAFIDNILVGFCYIETFSLGNYVSNSGLIVNRAFRGQGVAKKIKKLAFDHAREKFPNAKVFGITTSDAVMKINSDLGYKPVSFAQLTTDEEFWKGCSSCGNYDILMRNNKRLCLCTGMLAPSKSDLMKHDLNGMVIQPTSQKSNK